MLSENTFLKVALNTNRHEKLRNMKTTLLPKTTVPQPETTEIDDYVSFCKAVAKYADLEKQIQLSVAVSQSSDRAQVEQLGQAICTYLDPHGNGCIAGCDADGGIYAVSIIADWQHLLPRLRVQYVPWAISRPTAVPQPTFAHVLGGK